MNRRLIKYATRGFAVAIPGLNLRLIPEELTVGFFEGSIYRDYTRFDVETNYSGPHYNDHGPFWATHTTPVDLAGAVEGEESLVKKDTHVVRLGTLAHLIVTASVYDSNLNGGSEVPQPVKPIASLRYDDTYDTPAEEPTDLGKYRGTAWLGTFRDLRSQIATGRGAAAAIREHGISRRFARNCRDDEIGSSVPVTLLPYENDSFSRRPIVLLETLQSIPPSRRQPVVYDLLDLAGPTATRLHTPTVDDAQGSAEWGASLELQASLSKHLSFPRSSLRRCIDVFDSPGWFNVACSSSVL